MLTRVAGKKTSHPAFHPTFHRTFQLLATIIIFIATINSAHADLFGDMVNKAKNTLDRGIDRVMGDKEENTDSQESTPQNADSAAPAKTYDTIQVKAIQEKLNSLGYNAGPVDGQMGGATRNAIEAFERDKGLPVTGEPSATLLSHIKAANLEAGTATAPRDGSLPEPDVAAMSLAAVHFHPEFLDDEQNLKNILLEVHPELGKDVANEFKWRKRKDEYKQMMLEKAKDAQLEFEVLPWRERSIAKSRRIQLVKYDFDRQAFVVRFSVGVAKQVTPKMFMAGTGEPDPKYVQQISYIPMPEDDAEKISDYFGNKERHLYPAYKLRATGVAKSSHRPAPTIEFVDDSISLYALTRGQYASDHEFDFEHLIDIKLPLVQASSNASGTNQYDRRKIRSR